MNRRRNGNWISMRIDNQLVQVQAGSTILQAAQRHGIYIPTLCAHKDLAPFGGCRLCVVEVDGLRGFPTACTTPVEQGMVVRTHTVQLQQMRTEILRLILSEHPASCLVCEEQEECREYMYTIRKVGVTTGCRFCPNDARCELQDVVRYLGVRDIGYPVYYRGLRVEKEDPFYDRDYNLCILCGRCIRVCQDVRLANTLSFKQRGRQTVVGPAFERTHLEAGCEFCGACVEVCPTGALAEKARKWVGKAERTVATTCALCGLGCRLQLEVRGTEVIGSLPGEDVAVNAGQLCVKGRFCITELVNTPWRARVPLVRRDGAYVEADWSQALREAGDRLAACHPEEFGMLISANATTEELYVAHKFAVQVMHSPQVTTSASLFYGDLLPAYVRLFEHAVPLAALRKAGVILCVFMDSRFAMSVVGVELRRAQRRGAHLLTLHPAEHNLAWVAELWLQPEPGREACWLRDLAHLLRAEVEPAQVGTGLSEGLRQAARLLAAGRNPVIVLGPDSLTNAKAQEIVAAVEELTRASGAGLLPLPVYNNFLGAMLIQGLGAQAQVASTNWLSWPAAPGKRLKVLYLVGETVRDPHLWADYVICQHWWQPGGGQGVDVVLPAAAFSEMDGTFVNGEGRLRAVRQAVAPPGGALAGWQIIARLAQQMGAPGFDYSTVRQVQEELRAFWAQKGIAAPGERAQRWGWSRLAPAPTAPLPAQQNSFAAYVHLSPHTYGGYLLSDFVQGAGTVFPPPQAVFHPEDAAAFGISAGQEVELVGDGLRWVGKAAVCTGQPRGYASVGVRGGTLGQRLYVLVSVRVSHG